MAHLITTILVLCLASTCVLTSKLQDENYNQRMAADLIKCSQLFKNLTLQINGDKDFNFEPQFSSEYRFIQQICWQPYLAATQEQDIFNPIVEDLVINLQCVEEGLKMIDQFFDIQKIQPQWKFVFSKDDPQLSTIYNDAKPLCQDPFKTQKNSEPTLDTIEE